MRVLKKRSALALLDALPLADMLICAPRAVKRALLAVLASWTPRSA